MLHLQIKSQSNRPAKQFTYKQNFPSSTFGNFYFHTIFTLLLLFSLGGVCPIPLLFLFLSLSQHLLHPASPGPLCLLTLSPDFLILGPLPPALYPFQAGPGSWEGFPRPFCLQRETLSSFPPQLLKTFPTLPPQAFTYSAPPHPFNQGYSVALLTPQGQECELLHLHPLL